MATTTEAKNAASRGKAIRNLRDAVGLNGSGWVYQFQKGHWSWATLASPIGVSLASSDLIYPDVNIRARNKVRVEFRDGKATERAAD